MTEIVMPRLSDTMEEGTILRWIKRSGEQVRRGEELVEIETDKAAMVYEADADGVLETVAAEGDTLPVGTTIAHVGESAQPPEPQPAADEPAPSPPPRRPSPSPAGSTPSPLTAGPSPSPAGSTPTPAASRAPGEERIKASPVARRVAQERGVDLHAIAGSGPGGRIVKADVEAMTPAAPLASGAGAPGTPTPGEPPTEPLSERVARAKGETTVVELTRTQQTIARRMAESKATIPDFELQIEIDMEACVTLRTELKSLAAPEPAPTYNDMVVKACALALREYPRANGSYRDGKLQLHGRVNVGVAVASDDALVVPTVFDADLKSLGEIAREARALAERVRAGTITPPELGGGTFTVSNLGMYGVRSFTAIVNPPQAAILAVGSLARRAVVRADGAGASDADSARLQAAPAIVARQTLTATLVCDHRILYGADAARFLARVAELLEEPVALTL
jgi:pyruvate dehydrogenase E2 component (dihydrolipoamide acetyltransferase)